METNDVKQNLIKQGLIINALALIFFLVPEFNVIKEDGLIAIFFLIYVLLILYSGLIIYCRVNTNKEDRHKLLNEQFLVLPLLLMSCFAINNVVNIFETPSIWLRIYLISMALTMACIPFFDKLNNKLKHTIFVFVGATLIMSVYFLLYLMPFWPICIFGSIILGISLHVFAPTVFVYLIILLVDKEVQKFPKLLVSFWTGFSIPVFIAIFFIISWSNVHRSISYSYNQAIIDESDFPYWTEISKKISLNPVTEKYLKSDLLYQVYNDMDIMRFNSIERRNFDEMIKHDPLVMTASFFAGKSEISNNERIKILEVLYNARHQAQDRLWSGDLLRTSNIITNVKIFPDYRLAYTEKILSIENTAQNTWDTKEAIYTFTFPEGTAVTSLSLWVNGKEEKAYFTTKGKADSAYKEIVGYERRDPSVVRWQEGNTVSVRVFPCTPGENRRFKIGFTSPLAYSNNSLVYNNITFTGPSFKNSTETVKLEFTSKVQNLETDLHLKKTGQSVLFSEGAYKPNWQLEFTAPKISDNAFNFDSSSYKIENYEKTFENFSADNIYLDINQSWTKEEFDEIWENCSQKKVYVYNSQIIKLDAENRDDLFYELKNSNFSLFPFYEIENPQKSVFITKGVNIAPNLNDLTESKYREKLSVWILKNPGLKCFNIGNTISPYIKMLKELRSFNYDQGTSSDIVKLLKTNKFTVNQENDNTVVINTANIKISENKQITTESKAPDHLLRLFAYNKTMKMIGINYFNKPEPDDTIVSVAGKGYVVTPYTSLIVLETKEDYQRFGIEKQTNSLKNASMKNSGAVPEPHEWVLIGLLMIALVFFMYKLKIRN